MDAQTLKEIQDRLIRVTPGQWTEEIVKEEESGVAFHFVVSQAGDAGTTIGSTNRAADNAFIAHSKDDVRLLIEYIDELVAFKNTLFEAAQNLRTHHHYRAIQILESVKLDE